MNKVILQGRLTRDPEVRYSQGNTTMAIARYSLAVQRKFKRDNEPDCDFINCIAFGKLGEFAEKYLHKGMKIAVVGRIQTGNYKNKDGNTVYTTEVVVEEQEFCENKNSSNTQDAPVPMPNNAIENGFMSIPNGIDGQLPFK